MRGTCRSECDVVDMDPPMYTMVISSLEDGSALGYYCSFKCMMEDMETLVSHSKSGGTLSSYVPPEIVQPKLIRKSDLGDEQKLDENKFVSFLGVEASQVRESVYTFGRVFASIFENMGKYEDEPCWIPSSSETKEYITEYSSVFPFSVHFVKITHRFKKFSIEIGYSPSKLIVYLNFSLPSADQEQREMLVFSTVHGLPGEITKDLTNVCNVIISQASLHGTPLAFPEDHIPTKEEVTQGNFSMKFWPSELSSVSGAISDYLWTLSNFFNVKPESTFEGLQVDPPTEAPLAAEDMAGDFVFEINVADVPSETFFEDVPAEPETEDSVDHVE